MEHQLLHGDSASDILLIYMQFLNAVIGGEPCESSVFVFRGIVFGPSTTTCGCL